MTASVMMDVVTAIGYRSRGVAAGLVLLLTLFIPVRGLRSGDAGFAVGRQSCTKASVRLTNLYAK